MQKKPPKSVIGNEKKFLWPPIVPESQQTIPRGLGWFFCPDISGWWNFGNTLPPLVPRWYWPAKKSPPRRNPRGPVYFRLFPKQIPCLTRAPPKSQRKLIQQIIEKQLVRRSSLINWGPKFSERSLFGQQLKGGQIFNQLCAKSKPTKRINVS